jgi:type II secretory pathway pseudopilin PulG
MRSGTAFSLVELLVCVAVIALLLAILLPGLDKGRSEARQAVCAANLHQLGHALHMYAADYHGLALPAAYSDQWPTVYWWGTNDLTAVDHTKGLTWPYLHSELRVAGVYECPAQPWGSYEPQGAAKAVTSTYGYNGYYLCPPHTPGWSWQIGHRPWRNLDTLDDPQRVFAFADTMIDWGGTLKNCALLDPPLLFQGDGCWRANGNPTTSFRHHGLTNALHADGHVESRDPAGGMITSPEFRIGSVGRDNDPHYVPDWRQW